VGWQIIRQPDGKLSIFSSVVDDWVGRNLTVDEVVEVLFAEEPLHLEARKTSIRQLAERVAAGERAYHQFTMTYADAERLAAFDPDEEDQE
jgi:hypothetical protein